MWFDYCISWSSPNLDTTTINEGDSPLDRSVFYQSTKEMPYLITAFRRFF